jgi:hypothetical protein
VTVLLILTSLATAYIDDDYPDTLQIPHPGLQYVALRVEDSEHYSICAPEVSAPEDLAQIEAEWTSIFPSGKGFIHIGPHGREFTISMFHQLHCINNIRLALGSQPVPLYHVQHIKYQTGTDEQEIEGEEKCDGGRRARAYACVQGLECIVSDF